jgi:hypothetical protein
MDEVRFAELPEQCRATGIAKEAARRIANGFAAL